jgi:hypothetical protein
MSSQDPEERIREASAEARDAAGRLDDVADRLAEVADELAPQDLADMLESLRDRGVYLEETVDGGLLFASSDAFVEFEPVEGAGPRFGSVELNDLHFKPTGQGGIKFEATPHVPLIFESAEWGGLTFQSAPDGAVQIKPTAGDVRLEPTGHGRWPLPSPSDGDAVEGPRTMFINENPNNPPRGAGPE